MSGGKPEDVETVKAVERLIGLIEETGEPAARLSAVHGAKASRWGAASLWGSWGAAFFATVSTLTIVSKHEAVAAVTAILAAALSTFVATAKPAERATEERQAAAGFEGFVDRLRVMQLDLEEVSRTEGHRNTAFDQATWTYYENGDWTIVGGNARKVAALRKRLDALREEFEALKQKFPTSNG